MTRAAFQMLIVALIFALTGCPDDGTAAGANNPTIEPPAPTSGVVEAHITSSAQYNWSIPATAPAVNPGCDAPDAGIYGAYVEWNGFTIDNETYTCNACPGGRELWQGTWRAMATDHNPEAPFAEAGYAERLIINGNTWTMDLNSEIDGQHRFEGYFWCGRKPEVNNETTQFVFTKVSKEGAFCWNAGGVFSVTVLEATGSVNELLTIWKDGFDTTYTGLGDFAAPYCRVGVPVSDYDDDGNVVTRDCPDPFE